MGRNCTTLNHKSKQKKKGITSCPIYLVLSGLQFSQMKVFLVLLFYWMEVQCFGQVLSLLLSSCKYKGLWLRLVLVTEHHANEWDLSLHFLYHTILC